MHMVSKCYIFIPASLSYNLHHCTCLGLSIAEYVNWETTGRSTKHLIAHVTTNPNQAELSAQILSHPEYDRNELPEEDRQLQHSEAMIQIEALCNAMKSAHNQDVVSEPYVSSDSDNDNKNDNNADEDIDIDIDIVTNVNDNDVDEDKDNKNDNIDDNDDDNDNNNDNDILFMGDDADSESEFSSWQSDDGRYDLDDFCYNERMLGGLIDYRSNMCYICPMYFVIC